MKNSTLNSILISFLATIVFSTVNAAQTNAEQQDKDAERWFQIEVIVFQNTDLSDLKSEQWPEHIKLRDYQDVIDFLSPIPAIAKAQNNSDEETLLSPELPPALLAPITEIQSSEQNDNTDIRESELPFLPLQQQFSNFNEKLNAIKNSRKYRLLRHMIWRQPVFDANKAVAVRIIGGDDFSENFNPDGSKIQKASIDSTPEHDATNPRIDNDALTSADNTPLTPDDIINAEILESQPLNTDNYFEPINRDILDATEEPPENGLLPLAKPLPHVWELDGTIKVHLRRYLHIKLDLEIKQLQEKLISTEQFKNFTGSQDFLQQGNQESGFKIDWETPNPVDENNFINPDDVQADTLKVEYLQPYPLNQKRRVRSKEIHYFDNPILGVLVLITHYENHPKAEDEEQEKLDYEL